MASWRAGPRSVSMKPWIEASGVRISWLALATKSERIRSIITCSVCSRMRDQGAAAAIAEIDRLDPGAELLGAIVAGAE